MGIENAPYYHPVLEVTGSPPNAFRLCWDAKRVAGNVGAGACVLYAAGEYTQPSSGKSLALAKTAVLRSVARQQDSSRVQEAGGGCVSPALGGSMPGAAAPRGGTAPAAVGLKSPPNADVEYLPVRGRSHEISAFVSHVGCSRVGQSAWGPRTNRGHSHRARRHPNID